MKTTKQWWSWAVVVASLAFLLQVPLIANAQDQDQQDQRVQQDQPDQQALPLADGLTVDDMRALIRSQIGEVAS